MSASATSCYDFLVEPVRDRPGEQLELWAWYAAYDHVALAQLWGAMPALPREIPRFTKELRQLWDDRGRPPLPDAEAARHDALVDARHNLARWRAMTPPARSVRIVHVAGLTGSVPGTGSASSRCEGVSPMSQTSRPAPHEARARGSPS